MNILDILPHRYPFLLIDKILEFKPEENIVIAQKNVSFNEPFFQGHFPGVPVMPGVLILEALAQTGAILVYKRGYHDKIAVLLNIKNAKFRNPVVPGDILRLEAQATLLSSKGGKFKMRALNGDKIAVETEMSFGLMKREEQK
jgi:3-hydroxyacyl-[acyl-carrier-protein] dehydratase